MFGLKKGSLFKKSTADTETIIIAGLGNPGSEYEKTRHNCGYRTLDALAKKLGVSLTKQKFNALFGDVTTDVLGGTAKVILMKPLTYMNNSGEAIKAAADFYKVKPDNVIVIYDDCDIDVAAIRIRKSGSAGTHNGMKSCVQHLGTEEFKRIRVGIGKKMPNADMVKFVLGTFPEEDEKKMQEAFDIAADAAVMILKKGIDFAMNRYNTKK